MGHGPGFAAGHHAVSGKKSIGVISQRPMEGSWLTVKAASVVIDKTRRKKFFITSLV